jgi:hypothetical protein
MTRCADGVEGDDQNFSGPLMRFARGDMRDHIVSQKRPRTFVAPPEPCSGKNVSKSTFARFSEKLDFRLCNTICQKQKFQDYSITSSARARRRWHDDASVIAVFKLIASSNLTLLDHTRQVRTLKILPTKPAADDIDLEYLPWSKSRHPHTLSSEAAGKRS